METLKYSIEVGKIVEGALRHDQVKILNYTKQLIIKLEEDGETRAAAKFKKIIKKQKNLKIFLIYSLKHIQTKFKNFDI